MPTKTILIVDDETTARNGLEKLLCGEGFVVVTAPSGVEAIAAARREHPDIVVTDLKMPDMDGVELCARLRDSDPDLPVILATGFQDMESSVRAMRAGAQDYLIKPLQFDALLIVIERAIERRAQKLQSAHDRATSERLYEEAVAAIRLRDEVLSTVSHELKNLVCTAHLGALQLGKSAGNEGSTKRWRGR